MKKESVLASPDEIGWYWFKKNKSADLKVVFVNDDGEAKSFDENGDVDFLDDCIGLWQKIEDSEL
jgi:hypothetical protein